MKKPKSMLDRVTNAVLGNPLDITSFSTELSKFEIGVGVYSNYVIAGMYRRILFTTLRYVALDENEQGVVIPTCMDRYTPASTGLIGYISNAIASQSRLVLRKTKLSDGSYSLKKESASAEDVDRDVSLIELDFSKYQDAKLLKMLSTIMFSALTGALRGVESTESTILGLKGLSESLDTHEAKEAIKAQAEAVSDALKNKKTAVVDSESKISSVDYNIEPVEKVKDFIFQGYSNITGFPSSYFNGEGGSALSDTGKSDENQIRRACEFYFYEILNPALTAIFGKPFTLKPDVDLQQISSAISTVEMSKILSEPGALFVLAQAGLKEEHVDKSKLPANSINSDGGNVNADS